MKNNALCYPKNPALESFLSKNRYWKMKWRKGGHQDFYLGKLRVFL